MFDAFATLLDGASKLSPGPLRPDELRLLERVLQPGEAVAAHVRGRREGSGWTVWALTPQRLICVDTKGSRAARTYAHSALSKVTAISGKWGATLRLEAGTARESFFAADPELGDRFFAVLTGHCPQLPLPPALAPAPQPVADAVPGPHAMPKGVPPRDFVPHGGVAAAPSSDPVAAPSLLASLQEAAVLREKNLISEDEYAALKRRLLGA
jgi:hypothetical protein